MKTQTNLFKIINLWNVLALLMFQLIDIPGK